MKIQIFTALTEIFYFTLLACKYLEHDMHVAAQDIIQQTSLVKVNLNGAL